MSTAAAPPEGFVRSTERGPFTTHNGPFFHRAVAHGAEQAFFAEARHCNGMGLIHGGMLSAFLDGLLAAAVAVETRAVPVTIHLSVDYLGMGRAGDWVVGDAGDARDQGAGLRGRPRRRERPRPRPGERRVQVDAADGAHGLIAASSRRGKSGASVDDVSGRGAAW